MTFTRRTVKLRLAIAAIAIVGGVGATAEMPWQSRAASLGDLGAQLSRQQAHAQSLSASIAGLSGSISSLDGQIALVHSREASVRAQLRSDRRALRRIQASLRHERKVVMVLEDRLAWARALLSRQLVSNYESSQPDLVSVVLNAHGFTDLLDQIHFLRQAEGRQQTIIVITTSAKAQADSAARRLAKTEIAQARLTGRAAIQARALAGMNALLGSREAALQHIRAAQTIALAASQARGRRLRAAIATIQAQQAAAQLSASATGVASGGAGGAGEGVAAPASGSSGGWAIPSSIVSCESGGQNLPPNSAGASGYYQIIPSTWKGAGGTGPAAYLAPKSEQDAVAQRLWDSGAGASNWVCAGMVGIH